MKTPIIIKSEKFLNSISWFMRVGGITLWPFIIIRPNKNWIVVNHESIHIKQQQELLVIPFYLLYILEWFIGIFVHGSIIKSYYNISFEKEAYENQSNPNYLKTRKLFSWVKYIKRE
jgi:hypothetical protein